MVLWDAEKQTTLFSQVNARYAFFDRHGSSLGVVHCIWYSPFDWADNLYRFSFLLLDSEVSCVREQHFNLPDHCVDKGVILYDLLKNVVVKHSPRVFDTVTNKMLCKVDADLHPGSVRLTLDGRYLVVLEFSDPYCEHIQHLPSRNPPPPPALELDGNAKDKKKAGLLLDEDAQVIRGTTPELIRLSAKIRSDVKMAVRKQPSFRSITNAMVVAQKFQQSRSQACVIQ
nr:hypothetical protein BaRGS_002804 [Batillaria attramentaria]